MVQTSTLNQVLESIEMLSIEDQQMLVELLHRRLVGRIVFNFVENLETEEDDILLIDIGSHDEVY